MRARALVLALLLAAPAAQAQYLRDAIAARELICEFGDAYRRGVVASLRRPASASLMVVYESITDQSAEALSTQRPGRRPVRVRAGEQAVHLIEPVGQSVRVTTLTGCEGWKVRRGREMCMRFTAQHAWHFDTLAHLRPQGSFELQPSGALRGACEPWAVD